MLFVSVLVASMVSKVRGLNNVALFGVSILMGIELSPMVFVAQVRAGLGPTTMSSPVEASMAMVGAIHRAQGLLDRVSPLSDELDLPEQRHG